jgi:hypothetical protein
MLGFWSIVETGLKPVSFFILLCAGCISAEAENVTHVSHQTTKGICAIKSATINPTNPTRSSVSSTIEITTPQDQQTIRDNEGQMNVVLHLSAPLQQDEEIQILLDKKAVIKAAKTQFLLKEIERGEHQLQAQILRSDGIVVQSSTTVIFYLHRGIA